MELPDCARKAGLRKGVKKMTDRDYMLRAIELAKGGLGWTSPNPLVGAVIVKDGRIIGEGYHERCGKLHAERNAIASLTESAEGATLYVTLEPCCHYGKTPPCTEAILEQKIARVVIGSRDPNPLVAGKGAAILRAAGVRVEEDFMREECDALNPVFFHYITKKTPYVVMKYAMTMDGKTSTSSRQSKWITGEQAREHVHKTRNRLSAVMTGLGTILADDPQLTCRIPDGRNPARIICDTHLRTPLTSNVIITAPHVRTILATCCQDPDAMAPYEDAGCEILVLPEKDGHTDLQVLMKRLGGMDIDSILLEGGSALNWSALDQGIVHKLQAYIAPKVFGGQKGLSPIGGTGVGMPESAFLLDSPRITVLGRDILLESGVVPCSQAS
mgnify:CR=1 FL=1